MTTIFMQATHVYMHPSRWLCESLKEKSIVQLEDLVPLRTAEIRTFTGIGSFDYRGRRHLEISHIMAAENIKKSGERPLYILLFASRKTSIYCMISHTIPWFSQLRKCLAPQ